VQTGTNKFNDKIRKEKDTKKIMRIKILGRKGIEEDN